MSRPVRTLPITSLQSRELQRLVNDPQTRPRIKVRARIILHRASGLSQAVTAMRSKVNRPVVSHWEQRFRELGLEGLTDAKGRGRKPTLPASKRTLIENLATQTDGGRDRWTVRRMAEHARVSVGTVHSIWKAKGIRPHVQVASTLVRDSKNKNWRWRIAGLYLRPPTKVLAFGFSPLPRRLDPDTSPVIAREVDSDSTPPNTLPPRTVASLLTALSYLERRIFSQTAPISDNSLLEKFLAKVEHSHGSSGLLLLSNRAIPRIRKRAEGNNVLANGNWFENVESTFRKIVGQSVDYSRTLGVTELVQEMEKYIAESGVPSHFFSWVYQP